MRQENGVIVGILHKTISTVHVAHWAVTQHIYRVVVVEILYRTISTEHTAQWVITQSISLLPLPPEGGRVVEIIKTSVSALKHEQFIIHSNLTFCGKQWQSWCWMQPSRGPSNHVSLSKGQPWKRKTAWLLSINKAGSNPNTYESRQWVKPMTRNVIIT